MKRSVRRFIDRLASTYFARGLARWWRTGSVAIQAEDVAREIADGLEDVAVAMPTKAPGKKVWNVTEAEADALHAILRAKPGEPGALRIVKPPEGGASCR